MTHRLGSEKILREFESPPDETVAELYFQKYNGPRNKRFEPHGEGKAKFENGYRYEGSFRKGLLYGKGRLSLGPGYGYEGRWRQGMKHGMGRMHYPDCSWYEGEFRKDQRHGCGTYYYCNGARYVGNWYKNERHGVGSYHFSKGDITLKGTWLEGVARGPAEILMENCRYHGYWEIDHPKGPGYFSFDAKVVIRGTFYLDAREGSDRKELIWQPEAIEKYEYSKLPLEPLPLPVDVSDISDTSSSDSEECDSVVSSIVLSE